MELNGAKVLIDGDTLFKDYTGGTRAYAINLIKAYKALGAELSVLFFQKPQKVDGGLFFKRENFWSHLRSGFPLLMKHIIGISGGVDLIDITKDIDIEENFSFINDVNVYVSPGSNWIAKRFRSLALDLTLAPRPKVDIWHLTNMIPLKIKDAVRVATIHDINPLHYPNSSSSQKRRYSERFFDTIKDCRLILCDSEHTKRDLVDLMGIDPDRLSVNYLPALLTDKVISEDTIHDRLKSLGLKYGQYILFVSGIAENKNVKRLIEAYLSFPTDIPLVIAGKKYAGWETALKQLDIEDNRKRVHVLGFVSEVDKYILYKGAMFFALPSLYEGFGIPLIEAMSLGLPVLTSSVSCLPEVCGEAALYVDPYDVRDIAVKIGMMINDKDLRQRLIALGYERAKLFSMDNFIKGLKDAYSRL